MTSDPLPKLHMFYTTDTLKVLMQTYILAIPITLLSLQLPFTLRFSSFHTPQCPLSMYVVTLSFCSTTFCCRNKYDPITYTLCEYKPKYYLSHALAC
jgi:hypothetical protein